MSGWDAYTKTIETGAGASFEEAIIYNNSGVLFTSPATKYLCGFAVNDLKGMIEVHDKKNHGSISLKGAKFLCCQQTPDFTLWTHSGTIDGVLQKPVLILARTNTAAVLGIFNKRDSNVDNCVKTAAHLIANNL